MSWLWIRPFTLQAGTSKQGYNGVFLEDPSDHVPCGSVLVHPSLTSSLSSRLSSFHCPPPLPTVLSSHPSPLSLAFVGPRFSPVAGGEAHRGHTNRWEEALLTFPQGVQAVEHEVADGAADDTVVE